MEKSMTDRNLMQQALDALENSVDLVREDAYQAEKLYGNYPTRQGKVNGLKVLADDHEKAITALNERLAQPEQEPVTWMFQHDETGRMNYVSNDGIHDPAMFLEMNPRYALVCPLYTAPPQPEQQRMAKRIEELEAQLRIGTSNSDVNPYAILQNARIIEARPEQEPVAWGVFDHNLHDMFFTEEDAQEMVRLKGDGSTVKPLYTTPPQRKPLSDEQIDLHCPNWLSREQCRAWVRQIEAAHGIKGDT
jgi:hypothetical protein